MQAPRDCAGYWSWRSSSTTRRIAAIATQSSTPSFSGPLSRMRMFSLRTLIAVTDKRSARFLKNLTCLADSLPDHVILLRVFLEGITPALAKVLAVANGTRAEFRSV